MAIITDRQEVRSIVPFRSIEEQNELMMGAMHTINVYQQKMQMRSEFLLAQVQENAADHVQEAYQVHNYFFPEINPKINKIQSLQSEIMECYTELDEIDLEMQERNSTLEQECRDATIRQPQSADFIERQGMVSRQLIDRAFAQRIIKLQDMINHNYKVLTIINTL